MVDVSSIKNEINIKKKFFSMFIIYNLSSYIMNFILHLFLIICLGLKINSGCCCGGGGKSSSKNITVNEVKIVINKDSLVFNGKPLPRVTVDKSIVFSFYNEAFEDSYVFKIDEELFNKIIDNKSCVIPNFNDSHFGDISGKQYILAAVENDNGVYIIYCDNIQKNLIVFLIM